MPKLPPVYAFSEKSAGRSNRLPVNSTPWSRETFSLAHLAYSAAPWPAAGAGLSIASGT